MVRSLLMILLLVPHFALATDLSAYKEEPIPGGNLLVAAYFVMWLIVLAFVVRLVLQQARLQADLRALEDRLDRPNSAQDRP